MSLTEASKQIENTGRSPLRPPKGDVDSLQPPPASVRISDSSRSPVIVDQNEIAIFEDALAIMKRDKATWTLNDREKLIKMITNVSVFTHNSLNDHSMMHDYYYYLSGLFSFVQFNPGDFIFHFGDSSSLFYIILSGRADLYAPRAIPDLIEDIDRTERDARNLFTTNKVGAMELLAKVARMRSTLSSEGYEVKSGLAPQPIVRVSRPNVGRLHIYGSIQNQGEVNDPLAADKTRSSLYFLEGIPRFKLSKIVQRGGHLGEISDKVGKPGRLNTAIAATTVYAVSLNREAYHNLYNSHIASINLKANCFEHKLFGLSKDSITRFCYTFQEVTFRLAENIYNEEEVATSFYLLRCGAVQIVKPLKNNVDIPPRSNPKYYLAAEKYLHISNTSVAEFFGEEEYLTKTPRVTSAIVTNVPCSAYIIPYDKFEELTNAYPDIARRIIRSARHKVIWRETRIREVQAQKSEELAMIHEQARPKTAVTHMNYVRTSVQDLGPSSFAPDPTNSPKPRQSQRYLLQAAPKRDVYRKSNRHHSSLSVSLAPVNTSETLPQTPSAKTKVNPNLIVDIVQRKRAIYARSEAWAVKQSMENGGNLTAGDTKFLDFGLVQTFKTEPLYIVKMKERQQKMEDLAVEQGLVIPHGTLPSEFILSKIYPNKRPSSSTSHKQTVPIDLLQGKPPSAHHKRARSAVVSRSVETLPKHVRNVSLALHSGEDYPVSEQAMPQYGMPAVKEESLKLHRPKYYIKGEYHSRGHSHASRTTSQDTAAVTKSVIALPSAVVSPKASVGSDIFSSFFNVDKRRNLADRLIVSSKHSLFRFAPKRPHLVFHKY